MPTPPSRIGNYSEGFIKNSNLKTNNMNTYTITIGALALIGTGFSILLTLKYITLKTYYKRKCERHDQLNEQLATANDMLKDLFAEDKRKNAKLLAKNQEIQQLKEQAK
jgi:hypothetical protein